MKIAIIDKSPILTEGLGHLIKKHYEVSDLWACTNIGALLELHPKVDPDLVIIGMNKILHDSNLVVVRAVKTFFPTAIIVVVGERSTLPIVIDFLRAGVKGYITYSISSDEFTQCISKAMKGQKFVPNELLSLMIREKDGNALKKPTTRLTQREKSIASLLSNDQKASEIAKTLGVKAATVFATKRIIFKKLKIDSMLELKQACNELLEDPA